MKNIQVWVGLVAMMSLVVGCGGDGDGGGSTSNVFDERVEAERSAIATVCECFEEFEFTSAAECEAEFAGDLSEEVVSCQRAIYEENELVLRAELECLIEVFSDAEQCVAAVNACDPAAIQACVGVVDESLEECPEPPTALEDALEACEENQAQPL